MKTEDLIFYHGTGRTAADAILSGGTRDALFQEIGAFDLGRAILCALRNHANISGPDEDFKLHFAFKGLPGSEYSSLWSPAFNKLNGEGDSHFEYGHFFVTLNIGYAYRYAMNPYRSEFVRAIAESIKLLRHFDDPLLKTLQTTYPEILRAIEYPSEPVVIELQGIPQDRLLTAKGSSNIQTQLKIFEDMKKYPGMSAPVDFRAREVTPNDIVAIHDLSSLSATDIGDGAWQPDQAQIEAVRRPLICERGCTKNDEI